MGYEFSVSLRDDTCFMPASFAWRLTALRVPTVLALLFACASRRGAERRLQQNAAQRTAKALSSRLLAPGSWLLAHAATQMKQKKKYRLNQHFLRRFFNVSSWFDASFVL